MPRARERETQLILECQAAKLKGDGAAYNSAFSLLCKGHAAGVMAIARHATRNPEDADEITNDTFKDLDDYLPKVNADRGCFGLLRLFVLRRAAEKYSRRVAML